MSRHPIALAKPAVRLLALLAATCSAAAASERPAASQTAPSAAPAGRPAPRSAGAPAPPDLERRFGGRAGTAVVLEPSKDRVTRVDPARAAERFPPCSTFKIPNSAIAIETGVLDPERSTIQWDTVSVPRRDFWPAAWAADQDLASAFRNSVVWYYQELARRIGPERMQAWLDRFDYGNRDISGGIDRFWLESTLTISADEQVAFLRRLRERKLGLSEAATRTVESIAVRERGDGWAWAGKTGACERSEGSWIGWLVGWVERGGDVSYYAVNLDGASFADIAPARIETTRAILADLDLLPRETP